GRVPDSPSLSHIFLPHAGTLPAPVANIPPVSSPTVRTPGYRPVAMYPETPIPKHDLAHPLSGCKRITSGGRFDPNKVRPFVMSPHGRYPWSNGIHSLVFVRLRPAAPRATGRSFARAGREKIGPSRWVCGEELGESRRPISALQPTNSHAQGS